MYTPGLKYFFCAQRVRSLHSQLPLIKYLNKMGQVPFFAGGERDVIEAVKKYDVEVEIAALGELHTFLWEDKLYYAPGVKWFKSVYPVFDVTVSESYGNWIFERIMLFVSKKNRRTNIIPLSIISVNNVRTSADGHFKPEATKFLDGVCAIDKRTVDYFKNRINSRFFYLVTGNPKWDAFSELKNEADGLREKYDNRILVIGVGQFKKHGLPQEQYVKKTIQVAEREGFKVLVNVHPDFLNQIPDYLKDYTKPMHRYIRFMAASHIISSLASGMTGEAFYLGKKVGCLPVVAIGQKDPVSGKWHLWIEDRDRFTNMMQPVVGDKVFNSCPFINDEESLVEFLSSDQKNYTVDMMDRVFGWPRVDNYCSYFFETFEKYHMKEKRDV